MNAVDSADDTIDDFVAANTVETVGWDLFGASHTSNSAGSNARSKELLDADKKIDCLVWGWGAFTSVELLEQQYLTDKNAPLAVKGRPFSSVWFGTFCPNRQGVCWPHRRILEGSTS